LQSCHLLMLLLSCFHVDLFKCCPVNNPHYILNTPPLLLLHQSGIIMSKSTLSNFFQYHLIYIIFKKKCFKYVV
jgi:hypothetical protein